MPNQDPSFDFFLKHIEPEMAGHIDINGKTKKSDPLDQRIPGYDFHTGPVTIKNIKLPVSGKSIGYTFPQVPTVRQYQQFINDADTRVATKMGKMSPGLAKRLDMLPFNPANLLMPTIGRGEMPLSNGKGTMPMDKALEMARKAFGLDRAADLALQDSPDFMKVRDLVNDWVANKGKQAGVRKYLPTKAPPRKKWIQGNLSRDNIIRFTMHGVEGSDLDNYDWDGGGTTRFGITANKDAEMLNGSGDASSKVDKLKENEAFNIYVKKYWEAPWTIQVHPKQPEIKIPSAAEISKRSPKLAYAIFEAKLNTPEKYDAMSAIYDIYKNPHLTDDQKATAILKTRQTYFAMYGADKAKKGLRNRTTNALTFMNGKL